MAKRQQQTQDRRNRWPKSAADLVSCRRLEEELGMYEAIIASSDDAIISKTLDGIITSWNSAAESLFGYTAQEAIGQSILLIIPAELYGEEEQILGKLRQGMRIQHYETVRLRKDGSRVEVSLSISPIKDRTGAILGAAKIARDITRRKQEEQARFHLAALVESAESPILSKTLEGIITSWNRAAEQTYGYSAQEAVGQSVTLIFPPDRFNEFVTIMERIRQGERVALYDTERRRKDGTLLPVSVLISPIYNSTGHIIGASSIAHDISERKRIQAQEHFLIQVSGLLASSLDDQETFANIARLVVPQLADWFAVDLVDASGHFELIELAHTDPEQVHWTRTLRERYPIDPDAPLSAARVARRNQAELYREVPDELLVAVARNEEELALLRQIGYSSVMLVPLVAREKTLGVISFVTTASGKRYDERDLVLAEEVGRRVSIALDNARLYREVQQSRNQLDIILQGVADGIVVYAPESQIIYANEAAVHMTDFASVQQMQATPPLSAIDRYELIDKQGRPFPRSQITHLRVLAGEREAQAIIGYTRQGTGQPERWSLVKSRPVLGENGKVEMVISIMHDITERMSIERRKDAFISMMSHELKTPITSLKGFTTILQRRLSKQGDAQGLHYLSRMDAQLDKLTRLISELLDISRMQAGKLALRTEPVDLDGLIEETMENVQAACSTHHLLIEGRTGAQVMGDRERLGQVFINLLTNAIKYSPEAQTVLVRLWQDGEQAIASVQDFGIGIDKAHHEKIFERFYQVSDPGELPSAGLGIGLSISHEIVARHQGRMWVESSRGKGTTFFVALPSIQPESSNIQQVTGGAV